MVTPSSCFIATRSNGVEFSSLKWEHASFAAMNNWEGEIRGDIHAAYNKMTGYSNNLPNAYAEFDPDDTSLGCKTASKIVLNKKYYGEINTTKGPDFQFRCRLGIRI